MKQRAKIDRRTDIMSFSVAIVRAIRKPKVDFDRTCIFNIITRS